MALFVRIFTERILSDQRCAAAHPSANTLPCDFQD